MKKHKVKLNLVELNLIREWYGCIFDCNPNYLIGKDTKLFKKIKKKIRKARKSL